MRPANSSPLNQSLSPDTICILIIAFITFILYGPAVLTGRVMLPADNVPLMRPWGLTAKAKFPGYIRAQNMMHDPIFDYFSWRFYAREKLRQGEVPLWNSDELGGTVLLGNCQSAVLYPPNILLYVLPIHFGINIVTVMHTFLTGLFMFLLLKAWGLRRVSSLTGAVTWMICGLQIVWTEFQTPTAVLCWLPALLLCWEYGVSRNSWKWRWLGCSAVVGLILTAGHLQFAFYTLMAFAIFVLVRPLFGKSIPLRMVRSISALCGILIFGGSLAASTMLPVVEMSRLNFRARAASTNGEIALKMPPVNLVTLVLPNALGNPRDYLAMDPDGKPTDGFNYVGEFNFIEYCGYVSIGALLLSLIAGGVFVVDRLRRRPFDRVQKNIAFALLLTFLGFGLAMGAPICNLFLRFVPGYGQLNATGRALCLASFGMSMLAGFGVEIAARRSSGRASWLIKAVSVAVIVALAGFGSKIIVSMYPALTAQKWKDYESTGITAATIFLMQSFGAILAQQLFLHKSKGTSSFQPIHLIPIIIASDLFFNFIQFNPSNNPEMLGYQTEIGDFLTKTSPDRVISLEKPGMGIKSLIVPNYNLVVGYREAQGGDAMHLKRYHDLIGKVVLQMRPELTSAFTDANTVRLPGVDHPFLDLMNIRYVVADPTHDLYSQGLKLEKQLEMNVWTNPRAIGPAHLVSRTEHFAGLDDFLAKLNAPNRSLRQVALTESEIPVLGGSSGSITSYHASGNHVDIGFQSSGTNLLETSEIAYPGWVASLDGNSTPLYRTDYMFRSVIVPNGPHSLTITYEPTSYRAGLFLTCLGSGIWFFCLFNRKRTPVEVERLLPKVLQ
ncbi:MAG: hypothetical protein ABJA67_10110 [Chthonomonadales bacterium]